MTKKIIFTVLNMMSIDFNFNQKGINFMKNFISGSVVLDSKRPVAHIKLQNVNLEIGEYTCYFQTDLKMIVVEPSSSFRAKMSKVMNHIKEKQAEEARSRDESERRKISAECQRLDAEYRAKMSSSFIFINKGYDPMNMDLPKNCVSYLELKSSEITAILYNNTTLFLINPDDEWRYDNSGDLYDKKPFITILKNAI